jgi:beta-glucosidase
VVFELPIDGLGFAGRDHAYAIEPGRIELAVGSSSADHAPAGSIEITGATRQAIRAFATPVRVEPA